MKVLPSTSLLPLDSWGRKKALGFEQPEETERRDATVKQPGAIYIKQAYSSGYLYGSFIGGKTKHLGANTNEGGNELNQGLLSLFREWIPTGL